MWRWSWWQRRVRRCWPVAVVLATCISLLLLASRLNYRGSDKRVSVNPTNVPAHVTTSVTFDLPTADPGLATWVVLDAGRRPGADVCGSVYSKVFPEWTILIYGTDKPDRNSVSRCRYLPAGDSQETPDPQVPASRLPVKQRAFLFAVKNGAQAIFVPEGGRSLAGREARPRVFTSSSHHGLIHHSSTGTFDGIHHFGCHQTRHTHGDGGHNVHESSMPPRDDADGGGGGSHTATYRLCQHLEPPALQVVAWLPVQPFDIHQEGTNRSSSMDPCDKRAPPVTLHNKTLADIHLKEGLYSRSVFWALGFLMDDDDDDYSAKSGNMKGQHIHSNSLGRGMRAIALGYALQRLLEISGQYVQVRYSGIAIGGALLAATGQKERGDEQSLRGDHLATVRQAVAQWACSKQDLMACVRDLLQHLGGLKLLERHHMAAVRSWMDALEEAQGQEAVGAGRGEPHLTGQSQATLGTCKQERVLYHPLYPRANNMPWKRYWTQPRLSLRHEQLIRKTVSDTCSGFSIKAHPLNPVNFTHSWVQLDNLVLVVVFNNPLYNVIPYIEALYRPFFPYIVYCGPGVPDIKSFPILKDYQITFVSYGGTPKGHFPGSFNYECVAMVSRMHFVTAGYYVVSDDMFVSVSRVSEFPLHRHWFIPKQEVRIGEVRKLRECRLGMCDFHTTWRWWEDYQKQILSVLSHLKNNHRHSRLLYKCHRQLVSVTGGQGRALGAYSDTFFIPEDYASEFAELTDIFLRYQVFLEVAVPTMLHCLQLPDQIVAMKGIPGFDLGRDRPHEHFNKKEFIGRTFLHPTKWSGLISKNRALVELYCAKLLPHTHDPYGRLND